MNQDQMLNNYADLSHCETVARILARELPGLSLMSEPAGLIETLETISDEMAGMPEIIVDCRLAAEAFDELEGAWGRMYALADRAAELADEEVEARRLLDEEFAGYAHIVARLAGADNFDGPSLSLLTVGEARATRQILGYLNVARTDFVSRLEQQRRQINDAMDEAIGILCQIVNDTDELSQDNRRRLQDLVARLDSLSRGVDFMTPIQTNPAKPLFH